MSGADELYPSVQYHWLWALIALVALLLVVIGVWILLVTTRRVRSLGAENDLAPWLTGDALILLRREYDEKISAIEAAYREGSMTAREANLQLSRTVRSYVNEYSGLEAPVLTLQDLASLGVQPQLVDALHRHYYPGIFRRGHSTDPAAGAAAAREVVERWY